MDFGLSTIRPNSTKDTTETAITGFGVLDCHRFAHDGTATSENLKIGHASPAWRGMTSGGGERAKGGGRGLVEERAHGTRLTQ